MIIYTDKLIPERFAALTVGTTIFIRPGYKNDIGLCEHEKTHVRQFKSDLLYAFRYQFSKVWRLKYEAEAYAEQLQYCTDKDHSRFRFAGFLVDKYSLGITIDEALAALDAAIAKRATAKAAVK